MTASGPGQGGLFLQGDRMYTTSNIIGGQLRSAARLLDSRNPATGEDGALPQSDAIEVAAAWPLPAMPSRPGPR
jgi:hypothetical protein